MQLNIHTQEEKKKRKKAKTLRKLNHCNQVSFPVTSFSGSKSLSLESLLSLSGSLFENEKLCNKVESANPSHKISTCCNQTDKISKALRDSGLLLSTSLIELLATSDNRDLLTLFAVGLSYSLL